MLHLKNKTRKLEQLAVYTEKLVGLLPEESKSKKNLVEWLKNSPYSPYITLYGGVGSNTYNEENSFNVELDDKKRYRLKDEFSFKFENFISFNESIYSANTSLKNILNCKELFKAYPEFADIQVKINISNSNNDYMSGANHYNDNKLEVYASNNFDAMRVLLHELQHSIQVKEKFSIGESYYKENGVMDLFVGIKTTELHRGITKKPTAKREELTWFTPDYDLADEYSYDNDGVKGEVLTKELVKAENPLFVGNIEKQISSRDLFIQLNNIDHTLWEKVDRSFFDNLSDEIRPLYEVLRDKDVLKFIKLAGFDGIEARERGVDTVAYLDDGFKEGAYSDIATKKTMYEISDNDAKLILPKKGIKKAYEEFEKMATTIAPNIDMELSKNIFNDVKIFKDYTDEQFFEENDKLREVRLELIKKISKGTTLSREIAKKELLEHLKKEKPYGLIFDKMEVSKKGRLSSFLEHKELFEKYPNIASLRVEFTSLDEKTKGVYMPASRFDNKKIYLNESLIDNSINQESEVLSVLLHELQHAVQGYEGWANGGSTEEIREKFEVRNLKKELSDKKREILENNPELKNLIRSDTYSRITELEEKALKELKENTGYRKVQEELISLNSKGELTADKAYELYQSIWGEQQARAVQYRLNMSKEERLSTSWTQTLEAVEGKYADPVILEDTIGFNNNPSHSIILEDAFLNENGKPNLSNLKKLAFPYKKSFFTLSDFKKSFGVIDKDINEIKIDTPVGKVNIELRSQFYKLKTWKENRMKLSGIIQDTLKNPLFIVRGKEGIKYYSPYIDNNKMKHMFSVTQNEGNIDILKTNYEPFKMGRIKQLIVAEDRNLLYVRSDIQPLLKTEAAQALYKESEAINVTKYGILTQNNKSVNTCEKKVKNSIAEDNLKKWFRGSKITDSEGNPKVMYHGTEYDKSISEFKMDKNGLSFFSTDANVADYFGEKGTIYPVYINAKKVFDPSSKDGERIISKYLKENRAELLKPVMSFFHELLKETLAEDDLEDMLNMTPREVFEHLDDEDYGQNFTVSEFASAFYSGNYDAAAKRLSDDYDGWRILEENRLGIVEHLKNKGFDGIKTYEQIENSKKDYNIAVINPKQIKSIHNQGTFDSSKSNILEKNDYKLRGIEKAIAIAPSNIKAELLFEYLSFNAITKEDVLNSDYAHILNEDIFVNPIRLEENKKENQSYLDCSGEIEAREIEEIYVNQIHN